MRKLDRLLILLFFLSLSFYWTGLRAQTECERNLIAAENLYQSGQLYDIPNRLLPCLENGFNRQEKQNAYRLLTLTYLNINQEDKAKSTLHQLLKLNPDYLITRQKDPIELYNLYLQFRVDPVFYTGIRAGALVTRPYILNRRSSSSLEGGDDKAYKPGYGFSLATDFAYPLKKNLLIEFSPALVQNTYRFQSLFLTDGFNNPSAVQQVQEVSGRETYHFINLPFTLNFRIPQNGSKLSYNLGGGGGPIILLNSNYNEVKRVNRQIFTEEITFGRVNTATQRRNVNLSVHLDAGVEYKYAGYFLGAKAGVSSSIVNYSKYLSQQELYFNTMSANFGWIDDDFILLNGYFYIFVRKPIYKFLKD